MSKNVNFSTILLLCLLMGAVSSCLQEPTPRSISSLDDNARESDEGDTQEEITDPTHWFTQGLKTQSMTLNSNNQNTAYLRGTEVHNFLSGTNNYAQSYCMVVKFVPNSYSPKEYRFRMIPSQTINYATNKTEYYFRANVGASDGNSLCHLNIIDNAGTIITPGSVAYETSTICPTCLNLFQSETIKLYKVTTDSYGSQYLTAVENAYVPTSTLTLRINQNNDSNNQSGSCSDTNCQAQGYDCCIEGQCVNDGGIKGSVNQSSPEFQAVHLQRLTNPHWYLNYPNYYYACTLTPPTDGSGSGNDDPTNPEEDAQELLTKMNNDYLCIEELKAKSDNDPFHLSPYNGNPYDYSQCNVTNENDDMFYETVMKRLYAQCGCSKTILSEMIEYCPKYTYKQVFENGVLARIECVTPQQDTTPLPFQDLEVSVSSRSVPHRFFNTDGDEIDLSSPPSGNVTSEGDIFQYLDDAKLFPHNGNFNMNSILGQMEVSLTEAVPAKVIDVEFDKTYLIGTTQGMYTACPECSKDSWFANFTAFPITVYGTGLHATGYTTTRDAWGTNSKLGNYEDTIFGRACFVPPTMLSFSHNDYSSAATQRKNRLMTQAFMYVNGYQRDWYGFNKGALIGSFDGVSWFAVGKGRIAKATTNKLYLAINAPFADLAGNNQHVVSVQEYDFISTAALKDYDLTLSPQDARQNEAGSCQRWHTCNADADCITKLGWEYTCLDVTQYKTQWPDFEINGAKEKASTSRIGTIADFLNQAELSGPTTKRCVYRGAGAPCQADYSLLADPGKRKALSCAPNFYCAPLDTNEKVFNTEVARYGAPLENLIEPKNHLFGQDAFILGRPKHYISGSGLVSLNNPAFSPIKANLKENISQMSDSIQSQFGICRPGRSLPTYSSSSTSTNTKKLGQHQARDPQNRTDFISQIAGCNSSLYLTSRYASCPILDDKGNYVDTQQGYLNDNFEYKGQSMSQALTNLRLGANQNACGMESLATGTPTGFNVAADTTWEGSALKYVEARTLASSDIVVEPKFARDACFRRAGSVCHTDYDCSPNKLMAQQTALVNPNLFGNLAEKKYYEEYLVCGQANPEPVFGSGEYYNYDMGQNRCCRPIGETITLYTEDTPGLPESQGLRTDLFGAFNPTNPTRYSRYSNVEKAISSPTSLSGIIRPSANIANVGTSSPNILDNYQWKTISESADKTCCGGGWVRKFSDGGHNWAKTDRLNLEVENFSCLNYKSPIMNPNLNPKTIDPELSQSLLDQDRILYTCLDPTHSQGNCVQVGMDGTNPLGVTTKPQIDRTAVSLRVNTGGSWDGWEGNFWSLSPFISVDDIPGLNQTWLDWSKPEDDVQRNNLKFYIPSWLPLQGILEVQMDIPDMPTPSSNPSTTKMECKEVVNTPTSSCTYATPFGLQGASDTPQCDTTGDPCNYHIDKVTRVMTIVLTPVRYGSSSTYNPYEKDDLSVEIEFVAPGTLKWEADKDLGSLAWSENKRVSEPGDYFYYLKRLSRLEYIGIPQMTYEPLYCNTNYQSIVPGIFKDTIKNVHDFIAHSKTFIDPNAESPWQPDPASSTVASANPINTKHVANEELLDHGPIFSPNEFQCCSQLGQEVSDYSKCCTGYGVENELNNSDTPTYFCKLPAGADITVYLNRFISGEATNPNLGEDAVLDDNDFDKRTGEPKLNSNVLQKLNLIGERFCESGRTRRGGAFGEFPAEPLSPLGISDADATIFGIVDSSTDLGISGQVEVGFTPFYQGFRWNHHIYCDFE